MADEKKNTGQEQAQQPSLFDAGPAGAPAPEPPAPELAAVEPPAPEAPAGAPGDVVVSADQIEKLMAERRAAERAEVEKNEPEPPARAVLRRPAPGPGVPRWEHPPGLRQTGWAVGPPPGPCSFSRLPFVTSFLFS